ncbi:MAG: ribonucleotide-diphosphate reductase subunit beta [Armatimonadota bacterium]|nr:ribonucleotide-diphosphate reductase subunit beta [Armatimonadota bacterium]MDW8156641.1 ribonucleotide-diphosphate reductase subunit beta [Armatimonadota bacterium]
MPLTQPRAAYRPYEYPALLRFRDAVRHSYWVHTEFSYAADVQDYALADPEERSLLERSLVAISQVELSVKLFWAQVYQAFPKPEVAEVGMTFAESEVRHANAYAHLLDLLGLENLFGRWLEAESALRQRATALQQVVQSARTADLREYARALLLFSSFVEHISLFSQFYVVMALNRRGNLFRGVSNAVEATSKEENIHGLFGVELLRILRAETPELFDGRFTEQADQLFLDLYRAEEALVDWIFEGGESPFVRRDEVLEFVRDRCNRVRGLHGLRALLPVRRERLRDADWFDLELVAAKEVDFFNKRSVAYARKLQSFHADTLF